MAQCQPQQSGDKIACVKCGYDKFRKLNAIRECTHTGAGDVIAKAIPQHGPGSTLTGTLHNMGLRQLMGCGCQPKRTQMNAWGVDGCREHFAEIFGWLREAADEAGLQAVTDEQIRFLIGAAIDAAEQEEKLAAGGSDG